ncbi:uncharacterized protein LOC130649294 isoform X3 [Hydractinia symbiolongicarpus]|uniref:uncharacterized protein LOC130649294 isoform X3 n=1 Tax=Hydractinia symbiolongicarpus TaxID=13093 RepID=UPI00254D94FF|nr:uncharacterized protein LOC130649294 isoform X3 [Hydractinia symbiolongicarpus]
MNNIVDKSSRENMNSFVSVPSKESVNVDCMENIRYKFREESENREFRRNLETLSEVEEDMREQDKRQEKKGHFLFNSVNTEPGYESNSASHVGKREQHGFKVYEQSKIHLSKERIFQRSMKLPRTPPGVQSPSDSDIVDLCIVNSEESPVFTKRKLHKPSPKKDVNAATDATTALVDDLKKATADTSTLQVVGGSDDISVKDVDVLMQTRISSTSSDAKSFTIDFPAVDAIKLILPKFHALTEETSTETPVKAHVPIHEPQKAMSSQVATRDSLLPVELSVAERGNLDSHVIAVLDYQTKELDRYRNVIQTMGQDVIELRRKILKLQHEKSQLATKLYYAGDGVVSENGDDLEVIVPLKRRLAAENEEKNTLQERVYKLQNEIIKKNDIEASYLQLQEAHEIQQERMQQLQSKLSKYKLLQSTCQSQEKVIEELEKRLASTADNKSLPSKSKGTRKSNLKSVAYEKENNALRVFQIDEKLRLIEKLEQAEGTITALEEQLHINAKHWARDRALAQESSAIQRRLVPMPSGYMAATYNRRHAENDRPYLPRYTHNRFQNNPFGR